MSNIQDPRSKPVIIKKSMLHNKSHDKLALQVEHALQDEHAASRLSKRMQEDQDISKQVKLILAEQGLHVDVLLAKYKDILNMPHKQPLASDVIKVLDRLMLLQGINMQHVDHAEQDSMTIAMQSKTKHEVKQYIMTVTSKTQDILSKLDKLEHAEQAEQEDQE